MPSSITTAVPKHEVLIYRAVSKTCGDEVTSDKDNIVERFLRRMDGSDHITGTLSFFPVDNSVAAELEMTREPTFDTDRS
jgi:hypothetical protein